MILTVTLNSAIDKVLLIDEFKPNFPMQAKKVLLSVGGKGLDSSVVLSHLGVKTIGLTFVAGENGRTLIELLDGYEIIPEAIWVRGETRICYVIAETNTGKVSHIKFGEMLIDQDHVDQFMQVFTNRLSSCSWLICAGSIPKSLPNSFYGTLVQRAALAGVPTLVDTLESASIEALPYKPAIVKMNWNEFERTFNVKTTRLEDLFAVARQVFHQHHLENLVLTCGVDGIIAITQEGIYHVRAPLQKVVNAAGAGDGVSAALVWRLSLGDRWVEALRWAGATAAAVVLTEGTADCNFRDVQNILPHVVVKNLSETSV
ncbi:MAG: hypothetical protein A2Z45_03135 [Chloroflexi bacterium RBG_19FT_COMBO_55_16]|nr:MAG: hypothetical protein A2Z45_03135 [Chloroflexi bacterium RBG_19FT_COMBO_55_16]